MDDFLSPFASTDITPLFLNVWPDYAALALNSKGNKYLDLAVNFSYRDS